MTAPHILVVDDEPDIRELVKEILEDEGYQLSVAADGNSARQARRERRPDLILLDIWMPDIDGLSLFKEWQSDQEDMPPVVIMSGHGTVETAVEATRLGAYDFLEKPLSMSKLLLTIRHALDDFNLRRENDGLRRHMQPLTQPLGKSNVITEMRSQAAQVAESEAAVLLLGEPGVGKRLLARYIHDHSGRGAGAFVELGVNSNNPQELANKLFGEEESNGSVRYGLLEQANGGSLFLNEVGDLDIALQGELAVALQAGSFVRRGGSVAVKIDVRVISSSRKNLLREIKAGHFREDLYYLL
ncbi:sigma-54-dependent transcriptional regulator, partial [Pseudomonadota bacterium]